MNISTLNPSALQVLPPSTADENIESSNRDSLISGELLHMIVRLIHSCVRTTAQGDSKLKYLKVQLEVKKVSKLT